MKGSGFHIAAAVAALALSVAGAGGSARAQDFYTGQVQQFGTNWCPDGWQRADGTLLSISLYESLFALIGTAFGGDGVDTFGVPDLRDRAPVSQSATLPVGSAVGAASTTLTLAQMPGHSHGFNADPTPPAGNSPANSMLGVFPAGQGIYAAADVSPNTPMNPGMLQPVGSSTPVGTQMPVLATNWCIALYGVEPQRP